MLERTARLGDQHELDYLDILERTYDVVEFDRPAPPQYAEPRPRDRGHADGGADVLYQPTFTSTARRGFIGFADFIVRNASGEYEVYDTKLARHAKISALLQLAAYAEQIGRTASRPGSRCTWCSATARRARTTWSTSPRCTARSAPNSCG